MMTADIQLHRWRAFAVLVVSYFMTIVDLTIVNVSLPTIGRALHFSESNLQWVVTVYGISFGGFLLLGGRAADLLGRRRILLAGLVLFTAASLGAGLSRSDGLLIAMRGLQGFGAAVVLPAALSIVMNMFPEGAERNKALGLWGAIGAAGATVGLITGGLVTRYVGWQYIFFLNVPIGAAALALAPRLVPESRLDNVRRRFDPFGAFTVTGGLLLLVYAISTAPQHGWGSARTVTLLAVSAALLAAFLGIEARAAAPLMPLRIFRLPMVAVSNAVGFLLGASFFAFIFIGTLYMQQVLHYSALQAGVAWLAASLTSVALAGLSQKLVTLISAGPVMAVGMALIGGGILWATQAPAHGLFWADLAGPFVVAGAGTAFAFVPGIHRRPGRGRRTRGRSRLRAAQHRPAARRVDRRRGRVHGRGDPPGHPAWPGQAAGRRAHRRLQRGAVGVRGDRPARPAGDGHPGAPPEGVRRGSRGWPRGRAQRTLLIRHTPTDAAIATTAVAPNRAG
jgi:EmrB/QacA subfamily drug resistance transporter